MAPFPQGSGPLTWSPQVGVGQARAFLRPRGWWAWTNCTSVCCPEIPRPVFRVVRCATQRVPQGSRALGDSGNHPSRPQLSQPSVGTRITKHFASPDIQWLPLRAKNRSPLVPARSPWRCLDPLPTAVPWPQAFARPAPPLRGLQSHHSAPSPSLLYL